MEVCTNRSACNPPNELSHGLNRDAESVSPVINRRTRESGTQLGRKRTWLSELLNEICNYLNKERGTAIGTLSEV